MNIAYSVTTIHSESKKKDEAPIKAKHEPSPSYTTYYMMMMDHNGKIVVKYVGAYTKKVNLFGYLNFKLNLFCKPTFPMAPHGCLIVDAQII
jgi:hypothetical protein